MYNSSALIPIFDQPPHTRQRIGFVSRMRQVAIDTGAPLTLPTARRPDLATRDLIRWSKWVTDPDSALRKALSCDRGTTWCTDPLISLSPCTILMIKPTFLRGPLLLTREINTRQINNVLSF